MDKFTLKRLFIKRKESFTDISKEPSKMFDKVIMPISLNSLLIRILLSSIKNLNSIDNPEYKHMIDKNEDVVTNVDVNYNIFIYNHTINNYMFEHFFNFKEYTIKCLMQKSLQICILQQK